MPESSFITINNQTFQTTEISAWAAEMLGQNNLQDWEKEFFQFLTEWFSGSEFIGVQTSGSTGEPKLLAMPRQTMQNSARRTLEYFGLQAGGNFLLSLPCRYIAGKMMVVRAAVGKMKLETTDPSGEFELLADRTFDFGALVPNQMAKILAQPSGPKKLANIRNLLIGGSSIPEELENRISELPGRVVSTYGMTETASHIAIRELSGKRKSPLYNCLPGITVAINADGCLRIFHPDFAEPLQTSDLAEIISPEKFRILGRADSVIISGGIKFFPEEIEKKLEGFVSQRFIVSSVPDKKLGEKLVLVIEGAAFDHSDTVKKMKQILSGYEIPKSVFFVEKFPETPNGKIIRSKIREILTDSTLKK